MYLHRGALVVVVPLVAATAIVVSLWNNPWTVSKILGFVLLVPAFILLTTARLNLGNAFSQRPQATHLVTTGLYSRIRNPIYIFSTVGLAGLILYMNKPLFLPVLLPLIGMQVWRARAESWLLAAKFDEDYRRYREQTWF